MADKSVIIFYEDWRSTENLEKHRKTEHFKALRENADDLLDKAMGVTLFEVISES